MKTALETSNTSTKKNMQKWSTASKTSNTSKTSMKNTYKILKKQKSHELQLNTNLNISNPKNKRH